MMVSSLVPFSVYMYIYWLYIFYLYTLAVSSSLGGNRQHKRNTKTMGISLRSLWAYSYLLFIDRIVFNCFVNFTTPFLPFSSKFLHPFFNFPYQLFMSSKIIRASLVRDFGLFMKMISLNNVTSCTTQCSQAAVYGVKLFEDNFGQFGEIQSSVGESRGRTTETELVISYFESYLMVEEEFHGNMPICILNVYGHCERVL